MSDKLLTVFTPTYNRAHTLGKIYESLKRQTNKNFCWIIVDDGSTDGTKELIREFKKNDDIEIYYEYQENSGKPTAHNKGVELSTTPYFICLDSDDYFTDDSVDTILEGFAMNEDDSQVGAILALKVSSDDESLTKYNGERGIQKATLRDFYRKGVIYGDAALAFKTKLLKKFRFPHFDGEKFVPEAYLYDLVDSESLFYIVPRNIVVCEYLEDGYTANMARIISRNPKGYLAYIQQRLGFDKTITDVFFDTIRYDAIMYCIDKSRIVKDAEHKIMAFMLKPAGYYLFWSRYKNEIGKK